MGKGYKRALSKIRLDEYCVDKKESIIIQETKSDVEYLNIKNYIYAHFITPLIEKNYNSIQGNYFNFDYIYKKLNKVKKKVSNKEDVVQLENIVKIMQQCIDTRITVQDLNKKVYGDQTSNMFLVETTRIRLQTKYEVYIYLFGNPKDNRLPFNEGKLGAIEDILENYPGCTMEMLKEQLYKQYGNDFII